MYEQLGRQVAVQLEVEGVLPFGFRTFVGGEVGETRLPGDVGEDGPFGVDLQVRTQVVLGTFALFDSELGLVDIIITHIRQFVGQRGYDS